MVRKVSAWTETIMRVCLEGMGGFDDEETSGYGSVSYFSFLPFSKLTFFCSL